MKLKRLCGCGRSVVGQCECQAMRQASTEDYRASATARYGGHRWTQLSKRYRRKNPLCERCLDQGKTTPAIDVHHKLKAKDRPDLLYEWSNLMSVCRSCHIALDRQ